MRIRPATKPDVHDLAKLALIAGEGIPAWFWSQSAAEGQSLEEAGAARLLSETDNFSYRNALWIQPIDATSNLKHQRGGC